AGREARRSPAAGHDHQAGRGARMSQKIRGVKGTRDVLPTDTYMKDDDPWVRTGHYLLVEQTARELFPLYGYREARTPVLERTGRYRQFTQIGVEAFGSQGPRVDAEQIELLDRWLRRLGIPFEMHLNTLGDAACRPKYREALQAYLRSRAADLCEDCRKRTET